VIIGGAAVLSAVIVENCTSIFASLKPLKVNPYFKP
jgi:hypothetical protein